MDFLITVFLIAYLLSPLVLLPLLIFRTRSNAKRDQKMREMYLAGRIDAQTLADLGVSVPQAIPPAQTVSPRTTGESPVIPISAAQPSVTFSPVRDASDLEERLQSVPAGFPMPEFTLPQLSKPDTLPVLKLPEAPAMPARPAKPRREYKISAISVMLAVGVVLIVLAGMLFVRSQWSDMADFGKLGILAAGSAVFFGAAALARHIWKLERTGMAFFTIGAAFLPLSIWAAGYFELLGEALAGVTNRWTITLAFAAFTAISLIAVKLYKLPGWGAAFLLGLTGALICLTAAVFWPEYPGTVLIAAALPALLYVLCARPMKARLPEPIGRAAEPFAVGYAFLAGLMMFAGLGSSAHTGLCGLAAFLTSAVFLSPLIAEHLRSWAALPASAEMLLGFALVFSPLRHPGIVKPFTAGEFLPLVLSAAVCACLLLLLTDSLPEKTIPGFRLAVYCMAGTAGAIQLTAGLSVRLPVLLIAVLTLLLAIAAFRKESSVLRVFAAVQAWFIAADLYAVLRGFNLPKADASLIAAGAAMAGFFAFAAVKRLRSDASALLLTGYALFAASRAAFDSAFPAWQLLAATGIALLTALTAFLLAFRKADHPPFPYLFALMVPAALIAAALSFGESWRGDAEQGKLFRDCVLTGWTTLSLLTAIAAGCRKKPAAKGVFALIALLCALPPMVLSFLAAMFPDICYSTWLNYPAAGICVLSALVFWQINAARGRRIPSAASFGTAMLLLSCTTAEAIAEFTDFDIYDYPVQMLASFWMLLAGISAVLIQRKFLSFPGASALPDVMRFLSPATALVLASALMPIDPRDWMPLFFLTAAVSAVPAWLLTARSEVLLPAASVFAVLLSLEGLRCQCSQNSMGFVVLMLLCYIGLTILFPYLGIVARENITEPAERRRSYVLTAAGGIMPLWLAAAAAGMNGVDYSERALSWMIFFVPILAAGYLLHFLAFTKQPETRRRFAAAAGALTVTAFWLQPLIRVDGTYFEDKLHLIPLFAFGLLIRHLYGAKTGSNFLFAIGVYAMLRLGFSAIAAERSLDLLTVLTAALAIFIFSFYTKQKKWFLLGGISLCCIAVYMRMKLFPGIQWWVYLLLAGMVLIYIAAKNETLKQRGESLREKAGRFWEDWTW